MSNLKRVVARDSNREDFDLLAPLVNILVLPYSSDIEGESSSRDGPMSSRQEGKDHVAFPLDSSERSYIFALRQDVVLSNEGHHLRLNQTNDIIQ
jgi:hypothetical protein